jgi:hypothetical protein
VRAVERRWWRRRRLAQATSMATEETSLSGIDGGGVESGGDLESFGMKNTRRLLFIGSKISAAVLN